LNPLATAAQIENEKALAAGAAAPHIVLFLFFLTVDRTFLAMARSEPYSWRLLPGEFSSLESGHG
jgi:hypothetical protein